MNFLAHLHLAWLSESALTGNLLADFIRGNPDQCWDAEIAAGIRLHRRLDTLSDNLPEVKRARRLFRDETRRVAPIALDIIWDHFLARDWLTYHPTQSLREFCLMAEQHIAPHLPITPDAFQKLNALMWPQRWLENYAESSCIGAVLAQMAKRRPRLAQLANCYHDFQQHYHELERLFAQFYPQLIQLAQQDKL